MLPAFLFGTFKVLLAKSVGEELSQLQYLNTPFSIDHQKVDVAGQIHDYLTASAARRSIPRVIGDDRYRSEPPITFRDCLENRSPFRADCESIRADLHIASGIDLPIRREERRPDSKSRVGSV